MTTPTPVHPLTSIYSIIGQRVYFWRLERGMTQQELADLVAVARCSIANIEAGRQHAKLGLLYRICDVLDVGIYDVLPSKRELE